MSQFKIMKGVPVTKRTGGFGSGREATYPIASMQVGDLLFVAVEKDKQRARASYLASVAKKLGFKFVTRTNVQDETGTEGVGLWRLPDDAGAEASA